MIKIPDLKKVDLVKPFFLMVDLDFQGIDWTAIPEVQKCYTPWN